jgi:hypothetical protein
VLLLLNIFPEEGDFLDCCPMSWEVLQPKWRNKEKGQRERAIAWGHVVGPKMTASRGVFCGAKCCEQGDAAKKETLLSASG